MLPVSQERPFSLRALTLFFSLLFFTGWAGMGWMHAQGWEFGWYQTGRTLLGILGLGLLPGLAALVAAGAVPGDPASVLVGHSGRNRYRLLAFTLLPFLGALAAAVSVLAQWATWDFSLQAFHYDIFRLRGQPGFVLPFSPPPGWLVWLVAFFISPWIFLPLAWVEEMGWRGFGYAWLRPRGFWTAALTLGALNWLWRLPLYHWGYPYADHPWLGPLAGLGFQLGFGVVATWLREKSGSIFAPALARSTLFGAGLIPMSLTVDYDPLLAHLQGVAGIGLLGLLILLGLWAGLFPNNGKSETN
jgi:hypothetical protein